MASRAVQEPTFLVLTSLAAGPQHGYGIMTDVAQISGGRVRLRAGTLYAALDRLTGEGAVGVAREEVVDGRRRRYYPLTPTGARLLAAAADRLSANARTATRRRRGETVPLVHGGGAARPVVGPADAASPHRGRASGSWPASGARLARLPADRRRDRPAARGIADIRISQPVHHAWSRVRHHRLA